MARMNTYDVKFLLVVGYGTADNVLKKSATKHTDAVKGVSAGRPIEARELMRYYYGSPAYSDLSCHKQLKKIFGEDVMAATVARFSGGQQRFRAQT